MERGTPTVVYTVKCVRGCRFARTFGAVRLPAEMIAVSHALRLDHLVELTETRVTVDTFSRGTTGDRLPLDFDAPPF